MTQTKFTPGPWSYLIANRKDETGNLYYDIANDKGVVLANVKRLLWSGKDGAYIDSQFEENARLIAAAPVMLERLSKNLIALEHARTVHKVSGLDKDIEETRAAIAKATEQSS